MPISSIHSLVIINIYTVYYSPYVYPLNVCFPYFETDGAYWINTKDNTKKPVKDIRFAMLYGLAKELWEGNNIADQINGSKPHQ